MCENIKISVIVPVYKVEEYLVQCLESIINQTMQEIEIIVVDEGDMDRCREIIDYYESIDSRVIGIHEHNGGYGASVNRGISRAKGEYIGIVESDDYIELDMYEKLYERAVKWSPDIVKGSFCYNENDKDIKADDMLKHLKTKMPQDRPFKILDFPHLLAAHPSIWSAIYRRDFLRANAFPEEHGSGYVDAEFYFRIYLEADSIVYFPDVIYHWRIDNETSSTVIFNAQIIADRWENNVRYLENNPYIMDRIGPYVVSKIYMSFINKFVKPETVFSESDVERVSRLLGAFSDEHIKNAPFLNDQQRGRLIRCKNDSSGLFGELIAERNTYDISKNEISTYQKMIRKLGQRSIMTRTFFGTVISLLLIIYINMKNYYINGFLTDHVFIYGIVGCVFFVFLTAFIVTYIAFIIREII